MPQLVLSYWSAELVRFCVVPAITVRPLFSVLDETRLLHWTSHKHAECHYKCERLQDTVLFWAKVFNEFQNSTSLLAVPIFTTAELWLLLSTSVWYHQVCVKALTALCTAERPISNGLQNNCKNFLTDSIYIYMKCFFFSGNICVCCHI
jgi:hypothetical protein